MRLIQSFEFKIKWSIDDRRQTFLFLLFNRQLLLNCLNVYEFKAKSPLQFGCNFAKCRAILRADIFHQGCELQNIAFCTAPETLENSPIEIGRERRRVFLSIVIWQRTVTVMLIAFPFYLDTVMPKHFFK